MPTLTSNRPVDAWGRLLGDTAAVIALLDRLLHHAHVVTRCLRRLDAKSQHPCGRLRQTSGDRIQQDDKPLPLRGGGLCLNAIEGLNPTLHKTNGEGSHAVVRVRQRFEQECGCVPLRRVEKYPKQAPASPRV